MAATTDEEMDSLLSTVDQIYQDFSIGVAEIQSVKSTCNAEAQKRQALEFTCNSLKQENERLTRMYTESLNDLADQLERRSTCLSLKSELKRIRDECLSKEEEHSKAMELVNQDCAAKVGDLEAQIRGFMVEKAKNEANINHLQQELAAHKSHMHVMASRLDQVQLDVETKCEVLRNFFRLCSSVYKYWFEHIVHVDGFDTLYVADVFEIQDLKDCLAIEQEEKNELSTKLHELEKEMLVSRSKLVEQQRDSSSNWQVETLKSKLMKLRKENEILKRKLLHSDEG